MDSRLGTWNSLEPPSPRGMFLGSVAPVILIAGGAGRFILKHTESFVEEPHSVNLDAPESASELRGLMSEDRVNEFASLVKRQLELMGEDPARDGLEKTPMRVAKAYEFLTRGYYLCLFLRY